MGLIPIVASILSLNATIEKLQTPDPSQLANARTSLAEVLLGLGEITDAEAPIQQAMAIAEMDDLGRLRADCMRGALLAARHNWHDAEPFLVESAKTLFNYKSAATGRLRFFETIAVSAMVDLYEAWNKPNEAAR